MWNNRGGTLVMLNAWSERYQYWPQITENFTSWYGSVIMTFWGREKLPNFFSVIATKVEGVWIGNQKLKSTDYPSVRVFSVRLPWIAPECYRKLAAMTTESDIYAFGMTLWEMFSLGKRPYGSLSASDVSLSRRVLLSLFVLRPRTPACSRRQ